MDRQINLDGKIFVLELNSEQGKADTSTVFKWRQMGQKVMASYSGGQIIEGNIIGLRDGTKLQLLYHCLTIDQELRAGKAEAVISRSANGKLRLDLNWEWFELHGTGCSTYIEKY